MHGEGKDGRDVYLPTFAKEHLEKRKYLLCFPDDEFFDQMARYLSDYLESADWYHRRS